MNLLIGEFCPDLIIENQVVVEIKATKAIDDAHQAQLLNYLRASHLRVGLILNFGTRQLG